MIILKWLIIKLIRSYQIGISPLLPCCCRYSPTCSSYAIIAISKYGIIKGSYLMLRRILRCQPFGGSGYDPVP